MTEQEHGSVAMGDSREYSPAMKRIFAKLAEEGGGTWATYMMIEIDEATAARTVAPVEVYRIIKDEVIDKENVSAWSRRVATALSSESAAPQPAHGTSATDPAPSDHMVALSEDQIAAVLHLVESRLCIIWAQIGAREAFANELRGLEPVSDDDAELCTACHMPFEDGDMVYWNSDDTGHLHAGCCGPERESYVNADGEPLKDDEPIPEPFAWRTER